MRVVRAHVRTCACRAVWGSCVLGGAQLLPEHSFAHRCRRPHLHTLRQTPLTRESHSSGVSLSTFAKSPALNEFFWPLSLSLDKEGKVGVVVQRAPAAVPHFPRTLVKRPLLRTRHAHAPAARRSTSARSKPRSTPSSGCSGTLVLACVWLAADSVDGWTPLPTLSLCMVDMLQHTRPHKPTLQRRTATSGRATSRFRTATGAPRWHTR